MQIRFLNNDKKLIRSKLINYVVNILKLDGVVALNTDTVPGLICDINSIVALKKIYKAKQRNIKKPCSIFVNNINNIKYFTELNTLEHKLISKFFPGSLTMILKLKNPLVYNMLGFWGNFVGVRFPNDDFIANIIFKLGNPVFATSLNLANCDFLYKWQDFPISMSDNIDLYINRNDFNNKNIASSIIQVTKDKVVIIREGIITASTINEVIMNG